MDDGVREKPHLFGLVPEELVEVMKSNGVTLDVTRARQVLGRTISEGKDDLDVRRGLKKWLRAAIDDATSRENLELVDRVVNPADNFVKYLFRSPDGALSEAVRLPLHVVDRYSVCLSSQAGCSMGCAFCATGRMGLHRNLRAWEMVAAFRAVREDTDGRLTGAVFQGQGEPFDNYDEVIQAAKVLSNPCGGRISAKAISISTVGLVPQIRRFTAEGHKYRLIVSLTSAIPSRRKRLLPGAFPEGIDPEQALHELAEAIREHAEVTEDRVTVAWVLIRGLNSGDDEVEAIERYFAGAPLRFNLIDVNDPRPGGFKQADATERRRFISALQTLEVPIVRRYSGGVGTHAACGMLANQLARV